MKREALYVNNLSTSRSPEQNIDHISFCLEQGQIFGVTGLHGSGMTGLSAALCGRRHLSSGKIYLYGERVRYTTREQANRLGIYEITQDLAVVQQLSNADNLNIIRKLPAGEFLVNKKKARENTRRIFEHYGFKGDPDGYTYGLSDGEQVQLAICRAVICGAKILVCSEVGEGFSEAELNSLYKFLRQLCEEGLSVIFITPDVRKVLRFADYVTVMRGGYICYQRRISDAKYDDILKCMAAKPVGEITRVQRNFPDGSPQISFKNLSMSEFEGRLVNTCISKGEAVGLFWNWQNCGDDVLRLFTGEGKGTGTVDDDGKSCNFSEWRYKNRYRIYALGMRFWERNLIETMTVAENLELRTYHRFRDRLGVINKNMTELAVREFAEIHDIDRSYLNMYPRHLPPELRNQIVLWNVLFAPPRLLLLDCPMYTMDELIRYSFFSCLEEIRASGTAVLWSDNSEIPFYYCDRVVTV